MQDDAPIRVKVRGREVAEIPLSAMEREQREQEASRDRDEIQQRQARINARAALIRRLKDGRSEVDSADLKALLLEVVEALGWTDAGLD